MLRAYLRRLLRRVALHLDTNDRRTVVTRGEQMLLIADWRRRRESGLPLPPLADVEFRCFSQTGEDGLLLFVLTMIGFGARTVVELGCGDGRECNAANLLLNHGFTGLLVDGDPARIAIAREFYADAASTRVWPPQIVESFVTRDSVDSLLRSHGVQGPTDVLSIDVDGMDFWIWHAITAIAPRVVIVEANNVWAADQSVAVPYSPLFVADYVDGAPDYSGASLLAFTRLARRKGYRLVGAQSYGFNAVFVLNGVGEDVLPEVSVESCLMHPQAAHARSVRQPRIHGRPLHTVD